MGVGKVLWHSLTEDGKVERVNIKFGKSVYEDVDVRHLNPIDEGSHSHPKRKKDKKQQRSVMIKLTDLVNKDSRFLIKEQKVPDHFDGGENIDIFGYKTKHFDICRSAVDLYEKLRENEEAKDLIVQSAKDMDHLFEMEKQVVYGQEVGHDPVKHSVELCNTISFKLGRIAEITNHGDEEEDTHFIQMHVMVIINRSK